MDALGEIDGRFQSISQVSSTYGKGAADTIVEHCGNSLILRCSASEQGGTSQFASRLIGQREVVHTTRSETLRPSEWMPSTTMSEQRIIEPVIMASEIERLPDLEGLLKLASIPDWMRVTLPHVSYPAVDRSTAARVINLGRAPTAGLMLRNRTAKPTGTISAGNA